MARYPGARWRPVARYQPGARLHVPMVRHDGAVDHTAVAAWSSDTAHAFFNTSGRATPHFWFNADGTVDQYIDTGARSSAVLEGNPRLITWETWDGFPAAWSGGNAPRDNAAIVEAKAKVMAWLHETHGIPLVRMPSSRPEARGFGWHRLGIDGNFPTPPGTLLGGRVSGGESWSGAFGKGCPTDPRIRQFVEETLPRAIEIANGDDMPLSDDDLKKIRAAVRLELDDFGQNADTRMRIDHDLDPSTPKLSWGRILNSLWRNRLPKA